MNDPVETRTNPDTAHRTLEETSTDRAVEDVSLPMRVLNVPDR